MFSIIVKVFLRSYISLKSATKVSRWCLPYCLLFSTDNIPRKAIEDKHWKWHMQSVKQDLCCYWAPQIATSSSTTVRTRAKKGSWQVGKAVGEAEKDCKVVESAMATGMGFRKSLHVSPWQKNWVWLSGDDLDLEREQNSMRLESVFMQVKSRYISDNHASRALRCFKKNCACCHWSRGLKVTFDVRAVRRKAVGKVYAEEAE